MKKLILLLSAVALVFASCTSDADPLPVYTPPVADVNTTLPKKMIYTETGYPTETYNYFYNGNKLTKITDEFGYSKITYTGDLITLIQHYDDTNTLVASEHFTYNGSNKLVTNLYKDLESDYGSKETYVYNADGTVTVSKFGGDATTQNDDFGYYKMFFLNREVVKVENYDSTGVLGETTNLTYDGKNNPYKNIVGWAQLQYSSSQLAGAYQNVIHNDRPSEDYTNTYTYDANNFPLTETAKDASDVILSSTQYFY
ncbi:hypothetical protein EQG63_00765 [Flavobacterium amnicola]|uniref:YD repeat-containing protein n=1 Tax=Flavobacterium amnicola TaxID=2506422 RepID=A0A4Q1K574_9FLAO|nr:hypothetical protein [Flavobacterium amnicola]RXR20495.1 hypothetical protein EQG63_00765 [Flavobacterium amnicola]